MPMFSGHLDILCETLFIASYPWSVKAVYYKLDR